jgi:hypothetical protein
MLAKSSLAPVPCVPSAEPIERSNVHLRLTILVSALERRNRLPDVPEFDATGLILANTVDAEPLLSIGACHGPVARRPTPFADSLAGAPLVPRCARWGGDRPLRWR